MQIALIVAVAVHVLAAVFWAGTTFSLARTGGLAANLLFRPQMVAATIAILSGGYLWSLTHAGGAGLAEEVLTAGALCAVIAAAVQGILAGTTIRRIRQSRLSEDAARPRLVLAYRVSAVLLALTIVAMTSARYL